MENLYFDKRDLKHCGNNVIIGKAVRIRKPQEVVIGDNVIIDDFNYIPCGMDIGSYTHISASCTFVGGQGFVKIGSFVDFAPGCKIVTSSNDYKGGGLVGPCIPVEFAGETITSPILIEDFVLLGCNTVVLPGSVMPEGMSTGAFTLVNGINYKPWYLYVGIPAKELCERDGSRMKNDAKKLLDTHGADMKNKHFSKLHQTAI